jgi:hypothetical protein
MVPVPPTALNEIVPDAPLHKALLGVAVKKIAVGSLIVAVVCDVHELASEAMIVYVPARVAKGLVAADPLTV